jgi:hypothetical protein
MGKTAGRGGGLHPLPDHYRDPNPQILQWIRAAKTPEEKQQLIDDKVRQCEEELQMVNQLLLDCHPDDYQVYKAWIEDIRFYRNMVLKEDTDQGISC